VAWIDHGTAPRDAVYRYVILPATTPDDLEGFRHAMESNAGADAPIRVMRQDSQAHIVRDSTRGLWGMALFTGEHTTPGQPVAGADRPVLLMVEEGDRDHWTLTAADPDLHLEGDASIPRPLQITLRGQWRPDPANPDFRVVASGAGETVIEFTAHQGRSFTVRLERVQGP